MDVVVWLRCLGLGKYEAAFRENEIDETVLPNLTAEDLKDLGVSIVGHRHKILDALVGLRTDTGVKAPSADVATAPSATSVSPEDRAERRQVTVMFSDLVGSTALSARMDPEVEQPRRACMRAHGLRPHLVTHAATRLTDLRAVCPDGEDARTTCLQQTPLDVRQRQQRLLAYPRGRNGKAANAASRWRGSIRESQCCRHWDTISDVGNCDRSPGASPPI